MGLHLHESQSETFPFTSSNRVNISLHDNTSVTPESFSLHVGDPGDNISLRFKRTPDSNDSISFFQLYFVSSSVNEETRTPLQLSLSRFSWTSIVLTATPMGLEVSGSGDGACWSVVLDLPHFEPPQLEWRLYCPARKRLLLDNCTRQLGKKTQGEMYLNE